MFFFCSNETSHHPQKSSFVYLLTLLLMCLEESLFIHHLVWELVFNPDPEILPPPLGPSSLRWTEAQRKIVWGLTSENLEFFLEITDAASFEIKRSQTICLVISSKPTSVMVQYGCASGHMASWLIDTINTKWYKKLLLCCQVENVLDCLSYISKTMPNHFLHILQQCSSMVKESRC